MRNTVLDLTLQLIILRLLDVFKREKEEQKAKSEDDSDEEPRLYLTSLHNLLQSQFVKIILTLPWFTTLIGYPHGK